MEKSKKQKADYNNLTTQEKKIYDSIVSLFPATDHDSAYDKAIVGGVNFQFINK